MGGWRGLRPWPVLGATLLGIVLVVLLVGLVSGGGARGVPVMDSAPPLTDEEAAPRRRGLVEASMRDVRYQVDPDITLHILWLRGGLLPAGRDSLPVFDDPASFALEVDRAEIAIDTASLGRLLTRYVFAYQGSPLRRLSVSVKDGELVQEGLLKKGVSLPFRLQARLSVMPNGEIRLDPHKVEVLGMGVRGLMNLIGLELDDLVKNNRNHGVRIEEDVLFLDPAGLLPPPRLRGHLTQVRIEPGRLIQVFGRPGGATPEPFPTSHGPAESYMYFRHSLLRFGKLTMQDADMLILDADTGSSLQFSLDRYHDQLVAGHHVTTPRDGLVVYMPDASTLKPPAPKRN